ncbi:hypothetical protein [Paraburkholderia sp. BL17N1]|uniref:hypothetical protein n=1 Tax=Paraburkholderia sp. BL17N1 TaxID=1938798 RepID=UPI002687A311
MQSIELDGPRIAPRIEYAAWVRRNSFADTFTHLLALRGALQSFYAAGLDAYRGEREAWSSEIRDALQAQPDNPYSADSSATTCSTGAASRTVIGDASGETGRVADQPG